MTRKVAAALRALQEEGYSFKLETTTLELEVGRIKISTYERKESPVAACDVDVFIDDQPANDMIRSIEVRVASQELVTAKLVIEA